MIAHILYQMDYDSKNKTVVVTGAAAGIGFAISEEFLKNGAQRVILLDINHEEGTRSANELNSKYGDSKAIFIKCDVTTDLEAVFENIISNFKTVDVLVNNAGVGGELRQLIKVNTIALIEFTIKFWDHMRKDKGGIGGTIINMGSLYGVLIDPFCPYYKASKFAVVGFSQTMGHKFNYDKTGVRVIVLCPGFTKTALNAVEYRMVDFRFEAFKSFRDSSEWQEVSDVGKAAVEVFSKAESGTAWAIIGGKPATEIKTNVNY